MSRKREKQRESRRELARQLGVDPREVPEELRSHARVCEPEMTVAVHVELARRGFLARALPLDAHAALFVVDAAGARLARAQHLRGEAKQIPGVATLTPASPERGEPKVRYTRPGHFFLVVLVTEGATADESRAHAAALADPQQLILDVGERRGGLVQVTSPALERASSVRLTRTASSTLPAPEPLPAGAALRFHAAAVLRVPAAHRVEDDVELPLQSDDGSLRATARVHLRV